MSGNDKYTKLLLHFNGNSSDSAAGRSVVNTPTDVGMAYSSAGKFGNSATFNSSNISFQNSSDWNLGTSLWTIDLWVNPISHIFASRLFARYYTAYPYSGYYLGISNGSPYMVSNNNTSVFITTTIIPLATWSHLAFVNDGIKIKLFINGIKDIEVNTVLMQNYEDRLYIGNDLLGYQYNGLIDELRISKGIARWTANFTPPVSPYCLMQNPVVPSIIVY